MFNVLVFLGIVVLGYYVVVGAASMIFAILVHACPPKQAKPALKKRTLGGVEMPPMSSLDFWI